MAEETESIVITFGGGVNSRTRSTDIDRNECVTGQNFDLDPLRFAFNRRKPFDLTATAPNSQEIRGFAQLVNRAGTITTLIQAGDQVYSWNGASTFTVVGTCAATSKLRGHLAHNWLLDQYVIITDLQKATVVKKWDGTTYSSMTHNLGGDFYAKYCRIFRERAIFANVTTSGTDTPHVSLLSKISDEENLSAGQRPSSSIGTDAAVFLHSPDLRPINGLEEAFGNLIFSTQQGKIFVLEGTSSFDYELKEFFQGSAVSGSEALLNIGNDVILGLPTRIESLTGTLDYGDVETNDLSIWISTMIQNTAEWTIAYDQRFQKVLCFPDDQAACWVMHKSVLNRVQSGFVTQSDTPRLSPWSKWITNHAMSFQPTCVMQIYDPASSTLKPAIFLGDANGQIFKVDGDGDQDGGTTDITVSRTSGVIRIPDGTTFDVEGWISYIGGFENTVTITFQHSGMDVFDVPLTLTLPAASGSDAPSVYNGSAYYNGNNFYSSAFTGRLRRRNLRPAGHSNQVQVKIEVSGSSEVDIFELGLRFRTHQDP